MRNLVNIVGQERMPIANVAALLQSGSLQEADLIFYYFDNQADPGHAGLYLNDAQKNIACHIYCRCDQTTDYSQTWDSVVADYCTLAQIL